jgi:hypothetical protein
MHDTVSIVDKNIKSNEANETSGQDLLRKEGCASPAGIVPLKELL